MGAAEELAQHTNVSAACASLGVSRASLYCRRRKMLPDRFVPGNHLPASCRLRSGQLRNPNCSKPEFLAAAPNQGWFWDITKLKRPFKWRHLHLFVILDIFSRYVAGWMVAEDKSALLGERLISESCKKQFIAEGQLTLQADRESSMRSKRAAHLLADLGITKAYSRPACLERQSVLRC